eukprot:763932-Hanusia_phi.AAC.7
MNQSVWNSDQVKTERRAICKLTARRTCSKGQDGGGMAERYEITSEIHLGVGYFNGGVINQSKQSSFQLKGVIGYSFQREERQRENGRGRGEFKNAVWGGEVVRRGPKRYRIAGGGGT